MTNTKAIHTHEENGYEVSVQIGEDTVQFSAEVIHATVINGKHCIQVKVPQGNIDSYNNAVKGEDCPHAAPFRYCDTCQVTPCPIGLGDKP